MQRLVSARRILNARHLSTESLPSIQILDATSEPLENIPRHSGLTAPRDSKVHAEISGIRTLPKAQNLGDILIPTEYDRNAWANVKTTNRPSAFSGFLAKREIDKTASLSDSSGSPRSTNARDVKFLQLPNNTQRAAETGFRTNGGTNTPIRRNIRGEMHQTSVKTGFEQRRRDRVDPKWGSRSHDRNGGQKLEARGDLNQRIDRSTPPQNARQSPRIDRLPAHRANSPNHNTRGQNKRTPVSVRLPTLPLTTESQQTNLAELFGIPSPAALRAQSNLENAGDYSRYLPGELKGASENLSPLNHARLVLARNRDVGLQSRNKIMRVIESAVGRSSNMPRV